MGCCKCEVPTVSEVLKRDGAKKGDKYTDGSEVYSVVLCVGGPTVEGPGAGGRIHPGFARCIHIPNLRRVTTKTEHRYVMKIRLHGSPEEVWGTETWAKNMQGNADVEYCIRIPGTERTVEA